MLNAPLTDVPLFHVGPVPITMAVVTTWVLMAVLAIAARFATRHLLISPTQSQTALEMLVETVESQISDTMHIDGRPLLPIVGGFFLFILAANWAWLIPGLEPPTARIETDMALAAIVFVAMLYHGIRSRGLGGFLKGFAEPNILMLPLNLIETFARIFSLTVRLFGNIMSGVFIVAILLSLAGLLVPVPIMALHLLTGAVQAYIFTILAMVFIGNAASEGETQPQEKENKQ